MVIDQRPTQGGKQLTYDHRVDVATMLCLALLDMTLSHDAIATFAASTVCSKRADQTFRRNCLTEKSHWQLLNPERPGNKMPKGMMILILLAKLRLAYAFLLYGT